MAEPRWSDDVWNDPSPSPKTGLSLADPVRDAVDAAIAHFVARQNSDGSWDHHHTGAAAEAKLILLAAACGRVTDAPVEQLVWTLRQRQTRVGFWVSAPDDGHDAGRTIDVSTSLLAYAAMRTAGCPADDPDLQRAARAIRKPPSLPSIDADTRVWLTLVGVPPMGRDFLAACLGRVTVFPDRPVTDFADVRELCADFMSTPGRVWRLASVAGGVFTRPMLKRLFLSRARRLRRRSSSCVGDFIDVVRAIFAQHAYASQEMSNDAEMFWSLVRPFTTTDGEGMRVAAHRSRVSPTATILKQLFQSRVGLAEDAISAAQQWLLRSHTEASGWSVTGEAKTPVDAAATADALSALAFAVPNESSFGATLEPTPGPTASYAAVVTGRADRSHGGLASLLTTAPLLDTLSEGLRWLVSVRAADGGWPHWISRQHTSRWSFGRSQQAHVSDVHSTARVLRLLGQLGIDRRHQLVDDATRWLWQRQHDDGCWRDDEGELSLCLTAEVIHALVATGVSTQDPAIEHATRTIKRLQNLSGGWSSARTTAWAVDGLTAAGQAESEACQRGVDWLLNHQQDDGSWDDATFEPLAALAGYHEATSFRL